MSNSLLEVPILVTAFNRPDLLNQLLTSLTSLGFNNVYVSIDGPRLNNETDKSRVVKCQDLVFSLYGTDSDKIKVSQINLGCKMGMSKAIDWFFSKVSYGIILEDDIAVSYELIYFLHACLAKYESNPLVGSVTGYSPFAYSGNEYENFDIYIHPFFCTWGWATWRDRWEKYDSEIPDWSYEDDKSYLGKFGGLPERIFWKKKFNSVVKQINDTWDYQFILLTLRNGWVCVAPKNNLVRNLGFREDGTHTQTFRKQPAVTGKKTNGLRLPTDLVLEKHIATEYLRLEFRVQKLFEFLWSGVRRRM